MPMLSEQLNEISRFFAAYVVMFVLFIYNLTFFYTPLSISIDIPLFLMVIYYWSIYRPTLIPPALIFVSGICFDLMSGFPVGVNSLIFLIARQVIIDQRLFLTGQPFLVVWLGFIFLSLSAGFAQWLLYGLVHFEWPVLEPVLFSIVAGILFFPVITIVLNFSHRILPDVPDQYAAVK